jgi:sigma-E factor negative regulatory protein RseB
MTARATLTVKSSQLVVVVLGLAYLCAAPAFAQVSSSTGIGARDPLVEAREMRAYIDRLQQAANARNFSGTFTVMSSGAMSTSRISHFVSGGEVYEEIELLDGARRTQMRHNGAVHTLMPDQRTVTVENRPSAEGFPKLIKGDAEALAQLYELSYLGKDRVAGNASSVAILKPRDNLRFGQRLWTDEKSGLLLKTQVIGPNGEVLEQVAFTVVSVNLPPPTERFKQTFKQALKRLESFQIFPLKSQASTAANEGWRLNSPVNGFREIGCYKRSMSEIAASAKSPSSNNAAARDVMQWVFTDGLASVSVFVERYQPEYHSKEAIMSMGATHLLTHRVLAPSVNNAGNGNNGSNAWWVTVLGEVPPPTLQAFAMALERIR